VKQAGAARAGMTRTGTARARAAPAADRTAGADPAGGGLPRVIYVAGMGRSGSTVLERLLGQLPGACPAGELVHLWHRGVIEGERCGCGEPFPDCPFWGKVGAAAFGGWGNVDPGRVIRLRNRVDRARLVPLLASAAARRTLQPQLDEYVAYYLRLYAAIGQASGSRLVIDSSKHASLAFCLRGHPGLDLRVIHLIRDSRAVAYSWSKSVPRPETALESRMWTYPAASAALRWDVQNAAIQLLSWAGPPPVQIRYEDFVRDPAATVRRIAKFADLDCGPEFPFLDTDEAGNWRADLHTAHTVSGNPMRFTTGRVPIRHDTSWRTAMPPGKRRTVTAMTLPFLARYGYLSGTR
jgi:hypothetical protein